MLPEKKCSIASDSLCCPKRNKLIQLHYLTMFHDCVLQLVQYLNQMQQQTQSAKLSSSSLFLLVLVSVSSRDTVRNCRFKYLLPLATHSDSGFKQRSDYSSGSGWHST